MSLISMTAQATGVGLESMGADAPTEEEIEYSYFLRLTEEQFSTITEKLKTCDKMTFAECKLPSEGEGNGRVRHYMDGGENAGKFELTTKVKKANKTNDEYNDFISEANYKLVEGFATSKVIRTRVFWEHVNASGDKILRRDGNPLTWELDLYVDSNSPEGAGQLSSWIKIEMECDKVVGGEILDLIPFDYEEIIISDTTDVAERAHIADLYNRVYNLL